MTAEERYNKRLELEKPVLDALLAWAEDASAKTAPKSALGKALHDLREQRPYLVRYLEDGRLELVQQPHRAQHKALCDGQEELAILQYPGRGPVQRCDLQFD